MLNAMLAALAIGGNTMFNPNRRTVVSRGPTHSRWKLRDDLPRGYPGAKLARKAAMRQVTLRHPGTVVNAA